MDWVALRISLQVALTATALAVLVGVPLAWALARWRGRWREAASALVLAPMVLPPTVLGYYLLLAVGRGSWVGGALETLFGASLVFTWAGAALASFVAATPFLVRTAQAGFESVDPAYAEAARTLGRGEWNIFFTVTLPLAWRPVAAGTALALARALGEFGATVMVAGSIPGRTQTMALAVYEAVQQGRASDAQALALTLTLVGVGLLAAVGIASRRVVRR
jgi:molybdate transport system permease protein